MKNKIFIVLTLLILVVACAKTELESPTGLLCELLRYPEKAVITDSIPEFSWIVPNTVSKQTGYRILISSSKSLLDEEKADYWDSGKNFI